ncbi:MAG: NapC/NirT family cytochrome c [Armatimonadetes bacterium]|nr:NapC/NirT family cytochrome c [Armatimonadota bacterium]
MSQEESVTSSGKLARARAWWRGLSRGRKVLTILAVGLTGLVLGTIGVYEYSASPGFCNSCHIMKPYYEAWKTSSHKDVACVECHYPPGTQDTLIHKFQNISQVAKFVTRTYGSKPYAEIEDGSCLRSGCHSTRLLEGKVTFKRGILFDHAPHIQQERRGRHLRCTSCHGQMVIGNHMEVTESTCFLCHFKGKMEARQLEPLGGCQLCHTFPDWDIQVGNSKFNHQEYAGARHVSCQNCHHDVAQGDGHASPERCFDCHNQPEKLDKFSDTTFLHDSHVTQHDVGCYRCHTEIRHHLTGATRPLEPACSQCHEAKHNAPRDMFLGRGGIGTPVIPSHMFEAQVDCVGCHTQPQYASDVAALKGQTFVASEARCTSCHGEDFKGMLQNWQSTFNKMLGEVRPRLTALTDELGRSKLPADKRRAAQEKLDAAHHNLDMVRVGKGVHNPFYAAELIQVASRELDRVAQIVGRDPVPLTEYSLVRGVYCAVLCLEQARVKRPDTVKLGDSELPHLDHHDYGLTCTNCHSPERHRLLRDEFVGCSECHHEESEPDCATCHRLQADFYKGKLDGHTCKPNPASESKACEDCHAEAGAPNLDEMAESCVECHEESYRPMIANWKQQGAESLKKARGRLEEVRSLARSLPRERQYELDTLLDPVDDTLRRLERAGIVHNPQGAPQVIDECLKTLDKLEEQAKRALNGVGSGEGGGAGSRSLTMP